LRGDLFLAGGFTHLVTGSAITPAAATAATARLLAAWRGVGSLRWAFLFFYLGNWQLRIILGAGGAFGA
jgi:formate/nitrite transporter FocA (FNT family)